MPPRSAASSFSLRPPIGRTRPRKVTSPVIATSRRTGMPVSVEIIAVTMPMPADGPSLGTAPSGKWTWMSLRAKIDRLDAIGRRARLHEAHRRLDRFLHHFAELAGRLDLALAGDGDRFDRQQFAADLGPGEAGDRADLVLFLADAVTVAPNAEEIGEVVRGELDALDLAFEDLAQRLAGDLGQLALQRPDAGFARVVANDAAQALVGEDRARSSLRPCASICFGIRWRLAISTFSSSV